MQIIHFYKYNIILVKEKDDELECEDTEENELDSSKLNADSDVKMTGFY